MPNRLLKGMEERTYQLSIAAAAAKKNTLVCLPTGLGKTNIAILLTAKRLKQFPGTRALLIAPTRPLVMQHEQSFRKFLSLEPEDFQIVTGTVAPEKRQPLYSRKVLFATPQTVQKDLENERFSLQDFSLLVIDELHHAIGKYAYPYIARRFAAESAHPRILGLTASPGSSAEKIKSICRNTCIEAVEMRTEHDSDVRPYVKQKELEWVEVSLPESFVAVQSLLADAYKRRLKKLRWVRTKKDILELQKKLQKDIQKGNKAAYGLSSLVAQTIKAEHALTLLETQGITILSTYAAKLRQDPSRAARSLLKDRSMSNAMFLVEKLREQGSSHPKMGRLCTIVEQYLRENNTSKIIVFANFRETVKEIVAALQKCENTRPIALVGQRDLSQKEQMEIIRKYGGVSNCLVTTSIGEEGLSLEAADLAIFYEPVPSEIRQIQRCGRVGRTRVGKVCILVTKKTRDETYRWAAHRKEKMMRKTLNEMKMKQ